MRSRSLRLASGFVALGLASASLVACSSDKADTAAAADTTVAAAAETPAAPAGTETTAAAGAEAAPTTVAGDQVVAPAPTLASPVTVAGGPNADIFYTAVGAGSFLTLAKLLATAGLLDTIQSKGPFTVFAPTDAAFAKIPAATLNAIAADKDKLAKVLTYHVVAGKLMSGDLKPEMSTVEGKAVKMTNEGGVFKINGATVAAADVQASNGVIHVIDTVLLPPDL